MVKEHKKFKEGVEEARQETRYYKKIAEETGRTRLREINQLSRLINDFRQKKEKAKHSEEKYRTILENIEDGYYELDIAGNYTFFNDSICKTFGYTNDELMGMNNREYTEKETAKRLYKTFNRVYKTGNPTRIFDWEIVGTGTTFFVYLPASEETIGEETHLAAPIETGKGTILLVDDEEIILDVGEALLTSLGYTVLTAHGGNEAIDILRSSLPSSPPDLVILDMIMPGMGGGETCDKMKEIYPTIKVLLSSGYSINGQAKEILKRGCNGFIQKPFTLSEVAKAIRE